MEVKGVPEEEPADLLSPADGILLFLYIHGGSFEGSTAELARRLDRDPSNVRRGLDELERDKLIEESSGGTVYELTEKGWLRVKPLTLVSDLLVAILSALIAAIFAIGFAFDFLGVPILHYGLESSAVASAIVLLSLYRREREYRSFLLRRKKRPASPRSNRSI